MCQSLFFNKVAGAPAALLKKRFWHRCFPVNFAKFLRTPFFIEHLWWLLFQVGKKDILDTEIQRYGNTKTGHKKAAQESDTPSRIIKENSDIFGEYLLFSFNDAIGKYYFPTKQANITPVFKTGESYSKDN